MTKVEAIKALMNEHNGIITLEMLYNQIEKYYPNAKLSTEWQAGLRGVLYRDIGKSFKKIDNSIYALIEYDEHNLLAENADIVTEKEVMSVVRTQQHKYRIELLKHLKYCPITMVNDSRLLVASHIKPWCVSTTDEKIDLFNGFILPPLYDKLFDSGLITFTEKKEMLLSSTLSHATIQRLNIRCGYYSELPVKGREKYLAFHNEQIFIR